MNEQPTIIFNRTGRELLLMAVGATVAYSSWIDLGNVVHGNIIVVNLVKGLVALIVVVIALLVAFVKVAQRPLEEWAMVWVLYVITPKVYIYTPVEESVQIDEQSYIDAMDKIVSRNSDEEDDYD
ncbi:MAG TPA: PrgI family protein [Ktedonobacteraceae bacterium]